MAVLDFWFDYSCPYAYLGATQVAALARRTGATLVYQPMLLGGVFRAVGTPQRLFAEIPLAKARHNLRDMERWAELFGVPLTMPAGHPLRTVEALRATLLTGIDPRVVDGFYRAYWVDGRGPSEEATMRDVLGAAGHDASAILARLDEMKDELRRRTDQAIALGIFGAPAFVVRRHARVGDAAWSTPDYELYWGQDRIEFVEKALMAPGA